MSTEEHEWPQSVDEAVNRLFVKIKDEDKATIRAMSKRDLIGLHFGLGMYIRNNFGLWQGNKALLASCNGGRDGFVHPDGASGVIIEALWKRLQLVH